MSEEYRYEHKLNKTMDLQPVMFQRTVKDTYTGKEQ